MFSLSKATLLFCATYVAAHGIVSDLKLGSTWYKGSNPFQDPYQNPVPKRIVWSFFGAGNGPVEDVSSSGLVCNKGASPAQLKAPINAGEQITFYWTEWPSSHKGPVMTYLAKCPGSCASADPTQLSFFKIDHSGYENGVWGAEKLIANNNSWTVTIPSDISSGEYMVRHELLALHSANNLNGAQFYPMCANLVISSGGSSNPSGVKFPGAYSATDPGVYVNIYYNFNSYVIPGPAVYTAGSGGSQPTTTAATTATTATTVSTKLTSSTLKTSTVTTSNPATTTSTSTSTQATTTSIPATTSTSSTPTSTTTTAQSQQTGCNSSVVINKCLDKVNSWIASQQPNPNFSAAEDMRKICNSLFS